MEELIKNIKWNQVSLDGLLDFILNESKILTLSTTLQNIVISEFSRRFKEEYAKDMGTSGDTKLLTNGSNQMWNANNPTPQTIESLIHRRATFDWLTFPTLARPEKTWPHATSRLKRMAEFDNTVALISDLAVPHETTFIVVKSTRSR